MDEIVEFIATRVSESPGAEFYHLIVRPGDVIPTMTFEDTYPGISIHLASDDYSIEDAEHLRQLESDAQRVLTAKREQKRIAAAKAAELEEARRLRDQRARDRAELARLTEKLLKEK
jgi:hypothetical protein